MSNIEDQLKDIPPARRILLLPHCLRRSATCKAAYDSQGLQCRHCDPDCPVNHLTNAAVKCRYMGICVAPGGRLAVNYVSQMMPEAIVAVACEKELEEGIQGVQELDLGEGKTPLIMVIPLTKDGCVDTEVDVEYALRTIALGCPAPVEQD